MSTLTTRLKLLKPAPTDSVDVTLQLANNYDLLDTVAPNTLCTAASRPSVPFDGQVIWESDTDITRIWNNTAARWQQLGQKFLLSTDARPVGALIGDRIFETDTAIERVWNGTRFKPVNEGNVYGNEATNADWNINSTPRMNITTVSFTADGLTPYDFEYYLVSWYCTAASLDSNSLSISIEQSSDGGGTFPTVVCVGSQRLGHASNGSDSGPFYMKRRFTPTSGAKQFRITAVVNNTNATTNNGTAKVSWLRITER